MHAPIVSLFCDFSYYHKIMNSGRAHAVYARVFVRVVMAVCRLRLQKADKHYTLLYSRKSLGKNPPERISQLLDISMSNEPGYLDRVCRGCSDKFISVEKHLAQLKERAVKLLTERELLTV